MSDSEDSGRPRPIDPTMDETQMRSAKEGFQGQLGRRFEGFEPRGSSSFLHKDDKVPSGSAL